MRHFAESYTPENGYHRTVLTIEGCLYEGRDFDRFPGEIRVYCNRLSPAGRIWLEAALAELPQPDEGHKAFWRQMRRYEEIFGFGGAHIDVGLKNPEAAEGVLLGLHAHFGARLKPWPLRANRVATRSRP